MPFPPPWMITITESLIMLYSFIIFLFFNTLSNFYFWILLECNMVIFVCLCFQDLTFSSKFEMYDFSLFYFIIQSIGSLIFLLSSCLNNYFSSEGTMMLLILSILLKSALFPFYFWLYNSAHMLGSVSLFLILTLQKFPIYLFIFTLSSSLLIYFSFGSLISGSFLLSFCSCWTEILISSSIYSFSWIYLIFLQSSLIFIYFFIVYTMFCFLFTKFYSLKFFISNLDFIFFFFMFLFFLGLPPLSMFFFKFFLFNFVFSNLSLFYVFLVWGLIFFSLFGYMKFFYSNFLFNFTFYKSFSYSSSKIFFLYFFLLGCPYFMFFKLSLVI